MLGVLVFSYSVIPRFSGFFDYGYEAFIHNGHGFKLNNLHLEVYFPLSDYYMAYIETDLNSGEESFSQIFFESDLDFATLCLGKFDTSFTKRPRAQEQDFFISKPIYRSLQWQNRPFISDLEVGAKISINQRKSQSELYLVNGGGQMDEDNLAHKGKTLGGNMYLYPYENIYFGVNFEADNLFDTNIHYLTIAEMGIDWEWSELRTELIYSAGEVSGNNQADMGLTLEYVIKMLDPLQLGMAGSFIRYNQVDYHRLALNLSYSIQKDLKLMPILPTTTSFCIAK